MKQHERAPFVHALQRARESAYPPAEYVDQESFMGAGEIRELAVRAGVGPGVSVLDLCCGVAGSGRFITLELGCAYLGVDSSESALDIAREKAGGLPCRFELAQVPPIPEGPFDVVLLLETMLAFPDKEPLLEEISRELVPGGRFAFTLEEGLPLTDAERERDARLRHGLAHAARRGARDSGARRATRPLARGAQPRSQRNSGRAGRCVRGRFDRNRRAHRAQRARRAARLASAVERLAAGRTRSQDRVRRREGGVEPTGLEPVTFWLPARRSPN